jgi:hypothetical protein
MRKDRAKLHEWYRVNKPCLDRAIQSSKFDITEVVTGKAKGFDKLGESWADESHIPTRPFPAKWDIYGKVAGRIRNREMAQYADALIAITYGTPGTRNMINEMRELRKPLFVLDLSLEVALSNRLGVAGRTTEPAAKSPTVTGVGVGSIQGKPASADRVGLGRGH